MRFTDQLKSTLFLRIFSFFKIPLLGWVRPRIIEVNDKETRLLIPLSHRTKNHLGVMYFGSLAMGAEAAVAVQAVMQIRKSKKKVDFLFKDFHADFLKRAEGDVHFISNQGDEVRALIDEAILKKERLSKTFRSFAIVPSINPDEIIGEFKVTLSVKYRGE